MSRDERRLRRQITAITDLLPAMRTPIESVIDGRLRLIRIPLGGMLVAGGFLWFLPVFGLWMVPLGLLLLAVDLPRLRPFVSAAVIRARRRLRRLVRRPSGS